MKSKAAIGNHPGRATRQSAAMMEKLSLLATKWAGSAWAFAAAASVVLVWGATGPLFGYSDTWQLVINTGTTIVTFLMVFLIQRAQNKESRAIHLKLNELVAATRGASNHLIDVENLTEAELDVLHQHFRELTRLAATQGRLLESHSIEEARERSRAKAPATRAARA